MKINLALLRKINDDINKNVKDNFITNVVVINSSDILFSFSFNSKKKLLVSLNHNSPFIGFIDSGYTAHTELGQLNDNLRKYLKGAYLVQSEILNDDRVLKITLHKSDDFYEKQTYYLIIELIPTINNIILLDKDNKVIFAKHYSDLSSTHVVVRGLPYEEIKKSQTLKESECDYEKYQEELNHYILEMDNKKSKEKALPLYNHLKTKLKSLNRKLGVLEKEVEDAKKAEAYLVHGQMLLTLQNDKEELESYLKDNGLILDESKSISDNANIYFNKYKKSKRTIENDSREIEIAKKDSEEIKHILEIFDYYSDEEIYELYEKYLPNKLNSKKKVKIDYKEPYYVELGKTKIAFGKNKDQNDYLTFKKASKDYTFVHIANYHGSHVVIFNDKPSKDELLLASEIALLLSNKEDGEVQVSKIKDLKKGQAKGEVILSNYESFTIHEVRESTKLLLKEQKRFKA